MQTTDILLNEIKEKTGISLKNIFSGFPDEVRMEVDKNDFKTLCLFLHKRFSCPAMMFFCVQEKTGFKLYCVFEAVKYAKWFTAVTALPENSAEYDTLALQMHSAALFEREIRENFGVIAKGNPDQRRLRLHEEVWPEDNYPLKKDFKPGKVLNGEKKDYVFQKIEGEGIFEVPVGPVHAGTIGSGHFRFSVAGEPVINLEIRLGFTHRGAEKLFEDKSPEECLKLAECISGDSPFAHSLAFAHAVEKIRSVEVPLSAQRARCIFLELERMYNHVADMGGMALDTGFSFASNYASIIKENILALNDKLTGSRYLKGINVIGGVAKGIDINGKNEINRVLTETSKDFYNLKNILLSSVSFMDRADTTGKLGKGIAHDLGVTGLCAKACGIKNDLRKDFPGAYDKKVFLETSQNTDDALARLKVRMSEFEESINIIKHFLDFPLSEISDEKTAVKQKEGQALGYKEGWRGPVLYWVAVDENGKISRCKIVDPSFHNWQGLSYAVRNNIIPDFPLCNKSFNLSYSGNDL